MINEFKLFRDSLSGMTEELSSALRNLIAALEGKVSGSDNENQGGSDEGESDQEIEKRITNTNNYLKKLNERLKSLGAD